MTAWMNHPNLPETQLIQIPEDAVAGHQQMGWEVTDPPPEFTPEVTTDPSAAGEPDLAGSQPATNEPGKE